ncbi:MAG: type IV secretion system DNA-binding domain-containing protein [Chloroflexi bacterium]|nr:type IV secretion system DNA-binding domain-containing protein [Chloroflexota bacterium]
MKLNLSKILGKSQPRRPVLLAVTPPRTGERTMLGVENMLQSIAVPEPFSLELAGDIDGVTLMARCLDDQVVRGQVSAHYPQAVIGEVPADDDPLRLREGEAAWSITLRASGPEFVPLRVFRDDDLLDPGSDPLIAVLGALSNLNAGERIVARLMLRSMGPDWSQSHQKRAHKRAVEDRRDGSYTYQTRPLQTDGATMAVLGLAALAALRGYLWVQSGETWKAVLMGAGIAVALAVGGWAWHRWKKRNRVFDPILIREKVARIAFDAEVQVVAVLPGTGEPKQDRERARKLLEPVAAAYRHYDHPAGARFNVSRVRPTVPGPSMIHPSGPGLFGSRSVLGVREAAALWHPPGARDETPLVERTGSRVLMPSARGVRGGAPVGDTTAGRPRPIHFPDDLLRRHHLYVARTRMGKSTLMHNIVAHKLKEKAAGRDGDAIVVVDPHADLVDGLLRQVPESLASSVRLIDLADPRGAPGINVLDTRVFADRDRTADSVVRVAKGLWDQWGPRMQSILEQTVKTLHEANEHPSTGDDEQLTILDGLTLISDDKFKEGVLAKVTDPFLLQWWARDFGKWRRETRADALAPVQTRLSYYASSKRARAILGQPRSTIDLRRTIHDGGILLVSTAQGSVGRDVAALVGASLLNLVDAVIREQGSLPPEKRRGALVVVDEMQSMPGVDYESMLSELGKFGASFILATQSLAKLDNLSRTMRDTLLANVGCLAVFQVAGSDARQLVWELGKGRVTEDDIVSLAVHNCYVRATVGKERMPAFSMMVRKPEDGDAEVAERIRAESGDYVLSAEEIAAQQAEIAKRADEYRKAVKDIREGRKPSEKADGDSPEELGRKNQRSKHFQPPTGRNSDESERKEKDENGQKSNEEEAGE